MFTKMDPTWKLKWLEALRSGSYLQGRSFLRRDHGGRKELCCLGVLCDLVKTDGWNGWSETDSDRKIFAFDGCTTEPPVRVQKLTGVFGLGPREDYANLSLAGLNDEGRTFLEIADIIEKEF